MSTPLREGRSVRTRACYLASGVTVEAERDVTGHPTAAPAPDLTTPALIGDRKGGLRRTLRQLRAAPQSALSRGGGQPAVD
jgi:hypothetical protein